MPGSPGAVGGRLPGQSYRKTDVFQPHSTIELCEFDFHPYPMYEHKVVVPMLINLMLWEFGERAAWVCAKVRSHENSSDGDVADGWIEVHLECGASNLTSELLLLSGSRWCVCSCHGGI